MTAGKNPYHHKYQESQESDDPQKLDYSALNSIFTFIGCVFLGGTVAAGVGMNMWFESGQNPDNSGGTLIFFLWRHRKRASGPGCAMLHQKKSNTLWTDILYVEHRVDDDPHALSLNHV